MSDGESGDEREPLDELLVNIGSKVQRLYRLCSTLNTSATATRDMQGAKFQLIDQNTVINLVGGWTLFERIRLREEVPVLSERLSERCVQANVARRRRFCYWSTHNERLKRLNQVGTINRIQSESKIPHQSQP